MCSSSPSTLADWDGKWVENQYTMCSPRRIVLREASMSLSDNGKHYSLNSVAYTTSRNTANESKLESLHLPLKVCGVRLNLMQGGCQYQLFLSISRLPHLKETISLIRLLNLKMIVMSHLHLMLARLSTLQSKNINMALIPGV